MSIQTNIAFLNANDPEFQKACFGTKDQRAAWVEEHGTFLDRPQVLSSKTMKAGCMKRTMNTEDTSLNLPAFLKGQLTSWFFKIEL